MAKRMIRIVYRVQRIERMYASDQAVSFLDSVHQAFAALGWSLVFVGPAETTANPADEEELRFESDGGPLSRASLEQALAQVGILPLYCAGDIAECA